MMIKKILYWTQGFLIVLVISSFARKPKEDNSVQVTTEQENGQIVFYASNSNYCPYTVEIAFPRLKNMKASVKLPFRGSVPPKSEKVKLFSLTPKPNSATGYSVSMAYAQGDFNTKPEKDFVYKLPYEKGTSQRVDQGYGGRFSHNSKGREYAIDFGMDIGTKVLAAREGIVIDTRSSDSKGGPNPALSQYGNYVTIYHEDGTFANYYHLKKNGVKVKKGEKIKAGQWIGLSGNTGWSSGPHLHFEVFYYSDFNKIKSIPVQFEVGGAPTELKEGSSYARKK